ncbi:hypothetical protein F5144DRAFT_125959 [Chaetomium tenue]|uniref:Uncharacterized protein n=1 Tax=Chaetomium tenue TaxID=1854479 RepID=A0ACB7PN96_9PEZI|nr:hypothetical protein F5144DRAFT_125959 [Chaetomium globosum]
MPVVPTTRTAPAQTPPAGDVLIMKQQKAIMIFFLIACVLIIGFVILGSRQPASPPSTPQSGPEHGDGVKAKEDEPTETTSLLSSESSLTDSEYGSSDSSSSWGSKVSDGGKWYWYWQQGK